METINFKTQAYTESEHAFKIADTSNVFLKSHYNFCNAATYPHFAQFIDGKDVVTISIEKYHDISVVIHRTQKQFINNLEIQKFLEKQKGDAVEITRDEFFEYYNELTAFWYE